MATIGPVGVTEPPDGSAVMLRRDGLFAPAMVMLSDGAHRLELDQGLAFGLGNLAWAGAVSYTHLTLPTIYSV